MTASTLPFHEGQLVKTTKDTSMIKAGTIARFVRLEGKKALVDYGHGDISGHAMGCFDLDSLEAADKIWKSRCSTCPEWTKSLTSNHKGNQAGYCRAHKRSRYDNYGGICQLHPDRPVEERLKAYERAGITPPPCLKFPSFKAHNVSTRQ